MFNLASSQMGLPEEAALWDNMKIVQVFRSQQEKVLAFAGGLHQRLGKGSAASWLNDQELVLIADEVLEGWSLLNEWRAGEPRVQEGVACREAIE